MKNKKKKKGWLILPVVLAAGIIAAGCYGRTQREAEAAQEGQSRVEAGEGQSVVYGEIDTITGNEIKIKLLSISEADGTVHDQENGEQREYRIPVGTGVETRLGSITTFSRLTGGDRIALLLQQTKEAEEIIKIWIVG